MKTIETLKDLNSLIETFISKDDECILRVFDNKSTTLLQTVVVKHPVIFIRGIQEFCNDLHLPVSDVSIDLVGFITVDSAFIELDEIAEISPYVYFTKPEDVKSSEQN